MIKKKSRNEQRQKRRYRIRKRLSGTSSKPRLSVFRSGKHIQAQIIDDVLGHTLVSVSTIEKDIKTGLESTSNVEAATKVGTVLAKKALEKGIDTVVFDRGGYLYHGKVKALAEACREGGLKF